MAQMIKTTMVGEEAPAEAGALDITTLFATNAAYFNAGMAAQQALVHGLSEIGREALALADRRTRHNFDTLASLEECTEPAAAFLLECDFAQVATRHYIEEATKLVELSAEFGERYWTPFRAYAPR